MKKISHILFSIIAVTVLGYALITNHPGKTIMLIFFALGFCLAFLRLFVNNSIKKMKGKHIGIKLLFFSTLLGIGLPIQNWFRTNILFKIEQDYLTYCIILLVSGMIVTTLSVNRINLKINSSANLN
ncbi:hypothetical protein [Macrococcus animalis]|uniref:hypothetical protein n=1 Tax=Macrococcus animalis TaxID=3395467 RepID=UPI0039BE8F63